jgi:hypothetical protein
MGVRAGREDVIMPDCAISARACRFAARILTLPALALLAAAALAQAGCVSKARYIRPQRPG